jgi:hypothetical protein
MEISRSAFLRYIAGGAAAGAAALAGVRLAQPEPAFDLEARMAEGMARLHPPVDPVVAARFVRLAHRDAEGVRAELARDRELANCACPVTGEAPMAAAAHMGRPDIVQSLLASKADLTVHGAVVYGWKEMAEILLREEPAGAPRAGAHGIPLLYHAALTGDVELAEMVAAAGDESYTAALHAAAWRGHDKLAGWLLARGADPSGVTLRRERRTLVRLGAVEA